MANDELKPCPFCGGEAEMIRSMGNRIFSETPPFYGPAHYRASCKATSCICGAVYEDRESAVAFWNTRAGLSAMQPSPAGADDIDARMIAAGMIPLSEMLNSHGSMEKWMQHAHVNTMADFREWVSMKQREYMTMRMRYELGDKDKDDDLYEWVFAHAAVFDGIATQLRAIAGDQP